jgi:hypothetical protein
MEAFARGDVYIDYPYEDVRVRYEHATGKAYVRYYGEGEAEVPLTNYLFRDAMSAGKQITRDEYFQN